MASEKNITMRQFNGVDYDTLYPKTKVEQVEGAYTQQQILADSTKGLYGLGLDAVPNDVLALLKTLVDDAQNSADGKAKIETGSYIGVGDSTKTLTFSFQPKILIVAGQVISSNEILGIGIFPCVAYDTTRRKRSFLNVTISNMTVGGDYNYAYLSSDGKTITWSANGVDYALNSTQCKYFYVALG